MRQLTIYLAILIVGALQVTGCQSTMFNQQNTAPVAMSSVPAVRFNFRYEADVPAPASDANNALNEGRDPAVQSDFDTNRPQELLDRTILSPDKKRIVVVYHRVTDYSSEYRLDMYYPDGRLLKKMTSDTMAVHFPDTIVWSPDSASLAFVAMIRVVAPDLGMTPSGVTGLTNSAGTVPTPLISGNSNSTAANNLDPEQSAITAPPTPPLPTGILTFRTEQIYTSSADGTGVKAITQNEGLIYFYYAWSPDSSMLVALSATAREWKYLEVMAGSKGEMMVPQGRPRIIEKNGRERRLDDNLTFVRPVWSPDSSKVAAAFETQIRIYDASGTNPTQAAIPLRNQLLISSQAYDLNQQRQASGTDADVDGNTQATPDQPLSTLPDEKLLVSYNPIVEISWPADDLLYLQTAYLRRMRNEADSVRSFSRWHRLILTTQAVAPIR